MIFGRKKKQERDEEILDTELETTEEDSQDEDAPHEDNPEEGQEAVLEEGSDEDDDSDEDSNEDDDEVDHDLREDGPFDIDEVDLDADEIDRLDFGSVILTPFEDMQIQLQVDQSTNTVQSALVMAEQSALEVALFAAPARSSMVKDVAEDMVSSTIAAGGEAELGEGPFGPEIRRVIPLEHEGETVYHVSRTWFAQGPRWLLRGVLMGEAATQEGFEGAGELLFEFFCNVVVRRGEEPRVPGDLIPMVLPDELAQSAQQ